MQAIELTANISRDHELRLKLPDEAATGKARVIILFDADAVTSAKGNLDDFLDQLPRNTSGGLTHEEIVARVDEERAAWGDR
jgi:hypothetical protein